MMLWSIWLSWLYHVPKDKSFGLVYVCFRFPGITDWKFIMMNFEERVQVPVKKFSQSLYGHLVLAGGVVVRKISIRKHVHQTFH